MKREDIYERSQTAGQMEAVMLITTAVALVAAVFAFIGYGWLPALELLVLGLIAFALSRLFDLIGDLFGSMDRAEESAKPRATE
jgi:Zn-dependent protease with chaperone function